MCEIVLLIFLCMSLGKSIRAKGHDPVMYQVMLVGAWILGEIAGAVVGLAVGVRGPEAGIVIAVFALMGGACGGGIVFAIASSLKPRKTGNYGGSRSGGNNYGSGNNYRGNNNNQFVLPESMRDPNAGPPPGWGPPQQPYPPQYPSQTPYPNPYQQQRHPQYPPPPQPGPAAGGAIRFSCPQGHILEDDATAVGQQRSCPICNTFFVVPGPSLPQAKPGQLPPSIPQLGARPRPPGSKRG